MTKRGGPRRTRRPSYEVLEDVHLGYHSPRSQKRRYGLLGTRTRVQVDVPTFAAGRCPPLNVAKFTLPIVRERTATLKNKFLRYHQVGGVFLP